MEKEIQDLHHNMQHRSSTSPAPSSEKDPRRRMSVRSAAIATKGNEVVESFEGVVEDLYERLVSLYYDIKLSGYVASNRLGESEEENRELLEALEIAQEDLMKNRR